jgi:hypothetical protein
MSPPNDPIQARNLSAQLQYRAAGNPPSTLPASAISNAFPGLEMDFRNVWKRVFVGIQLHESNNLVVAADDDAPPELRALVNAFRLVCAAGFPVTVEVTGPSYPGGPSVPLPDTTFGETRMPIEWSNALADVLHRHQGQAVECRFAALEDPAREVALALTVRPFFHESVVGGEATRHAVIAREIAPPGVLSESLCSPWQNDYRECACFYWAASRPDYVNVEPRGDGTSTGQNWMQKDRTASTPLIYMADDWLDPALVSYVDLFRHWERSLRFVIGGKDEPPPPDGAP